MSLSPLEGEPFVVEGHGTTYINTAKAIGEAVDLLRKIRDDDTTISKAVDRIRDDASDVSGEIELATERYEVTGTALVDYAAELRAAQQEAEAAIEDWESAQQLLDDARAARSQAAANSEERNPDLSAHDATIGGYESAMGTAESSRDAAERRKNEAAEHAAALIQDIIGDAEINDSWWDDVKGFFSDAWDWIGEALTELLKFIAGMAIQIGLALLAVALIVAALSAATFAGALLLAIAGIGIAAFVLTGGADAFLESLFATGDWQRAVVAGLVKTLTEMFPGVLDSLLELEKGRPEHKASFDHEGRVDLSDMSPGEFLAWLQEGNLDADKQVGIDMPDGLDNETSSAVTVTEVVGPDGDARYVVNIPSTQVWVPGGDALNDITSGVAGKMGDERTQLEQAVIDAMERAGVAPGDSVILSGWSLGGITAGNLAADPDFASTYDVDGVVAAGSALDDTSIPPHIPVLQFEHANGDGGILNDPIPAITDPDNPSHRHDPNRTIVTVSPPDGTGFVPHVGDAYGETMQDQGDQTGSSAEQWVEDNLGDYRGDGSSGSSQSHVYQRGTPEVPVH
ncbi:hypothetical protein [uncultured Agrococcus sp.]|uniref:hypothetical protein n=1 Tax=uncultured Agrococcus sp. TaxID=382258 RepID=UPI0025EB779F|nr:hypothetical protein [uncultured Agrococcus sp.]